MDMRKPIIDFNEKKGFICDMDGGDLSWQSDIARCFRIHPVVAMMKRKNIYF